MRISLCLLIQQTRKLLSLPFLEIYDNLLELARCLQPEMLPAIYEKNGMLEFETQNCLEVYLSKSVYLTILRETLQHMT